jgi:hypothetical protein
MKKMLIKIHKAYRGIVAVCDSDLAGKFFEEGKRILDVRENFFKGDEKTHEELVEILIDLAKEDSTFFIVGKNSVNCSLQAGIISQEGVKQVQGVPFALVLL